MIKKLLFISSNLFSLCYITLMTFLLLLGSIQLDRINYMVVIFLVCGLISALSLIANIIAILLYKGEKDVWMD